MYVCMRKYYCGLLEKKGAKNLMHTEIDIGKKIDWVNSFSFSVNNRQDT